MDPVQLSPPPAVLQPMEHLKPMSDFAFFCAAEAKVSRFAVAQYVAPDVHGRQDASFIGTARRSGAEVASSATTARCFLMGLFQAVMEEYKRRIVYLRKDCKLKSAWQAEGLEWDSLFAGEGTWQYDAMWCVRSWWAIIPRT